MRNFTIHEDSDYDYRVYTRELIGRLTSSRIKIIENFVDRYNRDHAFPYGFSSNGYPYNCGHEHDCCGCLCSDRMEITIEPNHITLNIVQTFNY